MCLTAVLAINFNMTDSSFDKNVFFRYIKENLQDHLKKWCEPDWVVCVPLDSEVSEFDLSSTRAAGHALKCIDDKSCQYKSQLYGDQIIYEISGGDPRVIISHREDNENQVVVSKINILNEYLIPIEDKIVHFLLTDKKIENTTDEDQLFLKTIDLVNLTNSSQVENFLYNFQSHKTILSQLDDNIIQISDQFSLDLEIDTIQSKIHDIILSFWDFLIKTHSSLLQTNTKFQDLLFRALDFYVGGKCSEKLFWIVKERCHRVDNMTNSHISQLKNAQIGPQHLGVSSNYYTPLPAAVVELAALASIDSSIGRLQCISTTLDLIQAQAKEARLSLHQYQDKDDEPELDISSTELVGLFASVIIETQCSNLVSNIYYMTHFVFSVTEETDELWVGLGYLRAALEHIMKLNLNNIPKIVSPVRKELSLQDLMQMNVDMESKIERPNESQSMNDITALDLQLHQVTQRIQLCTLAQSESQLINRNATDRRSDRSMQRSNTPSRRQSFVEFLSNIPSNIRASFRKKQSQQKLSLHSIAIETPPSCRQKE